MNSNLILFDGVCNFCNFWVNFIIKRDDNKYFKFASLQSDVGILTLRENKIDPLKTDSIVLVMSGRIYIKSSAALQIARKLDGFWKLFYVLTIIPSPFRDLVYDFVARHRYNWFGKRDSCRTPTEDEKQ